MNLDSYLASITSDTERIAATLATGPSEAAVAACPGWDVRQLAFHLGGVHRWATHALRHGEAPERASLAIAADDASDEELADWLRAGAADLVAALAERPGDADTWHPFPVERKVWVWARRQAMETMVHRWDAEVAATGASSFDVGLALEGVHEYLELGAPRVLAREGLDFPTSSLHLHATDDGLASGEGEWLVWHDDAGYHLVTEHRKGDAALRGRAEDLLLVLMKRADLGALDVVGDEAAAAAWLDLPGW